MNEKNGPERPRLWTGNFWLVMIVNLLMFTSMYLLLPTLPGYATKIGGSEAEAGLIVGLFTISSVLVRPWLGKMLDEKGRKTVLIPGMVVFVLSALAYKWVTVIWILLALRIVHGGGWAATTTAAGTIAADVIPGARRGEGMGYYGISGTIAMSIGPALGLTLAASYSYPVLFFSSAAIGLASLIFSLFFNYEGIKGHGKTTGEKEPLIERTSIPPALVLFFVALTYGGIVTFLPLYADYRGIVNIGIFFTLFALVLLLSRPLTGKAADKFGAGPVLVPGIFFIIAAVVVLALSSTLSMFLFSGVLYGIGFGTIQPVLAAVTISLAPFKRRGAANATFFSAMDLGIGLGAIILGFLSEKFGFPAMYGISALFPLLALGAYLIFLRGRVANLREQPTVGSSSQG